MYAENTEDFEFWMECQNGGDGKFWLVRKANDEVEEIFDRINGYVG